MGQGEISKVVYEDSGITKVLRGKIIKDSDFTIEVEALNDKQVITIGKRAIIKISKEVYN